MSNIQSPIFIVGSARSGTSLVYAILQSSGVYAKYSAETLLLRTCADKYRSLSTNSNYKKFISDWLSSKQFIRSGLVASEFERGAKNHCGDYFQILNYFMTEVAEKQGVEYWAENTPNHVLEITNIAKYFPTSKIIHVIRDGRASSESLRKLGWTSLKTPLLSLVTAALHWQKQVLWGAKQGEMLGSRYMEVHYERLVQEPEKVLSEISQFTGTKIDLVTLNANPCGALKRNNSAFGGSDTQLFSTSALTRWQSNLSANEHKIVNLIIGDTLQRFGYIVGERASGHYFLIAYCKLIYKVKEWLRHKTILGKFSKTGLEIENE